MSDDAHEMLRKGAQWLMGVAFLSVVCSGERLIPTRNPLNQERLAPELTSTCRIHAGY